MTLMMRDLENQEIGIQKDRAEERTNMIADMLRDGKTPEEISSFCKIPIEEVKKVQEGLLQMA